MDTTIIWNVVWGMSADGLTNFMLKKMHVFNLVLLTIVLQFFKTAFFAELTPPNAYM